MERLPSPMLRKNSIGKSGTLHIDARAAAVGKNMPKAAAVALGSDRTSLEY
jgi:elongation factor P--beta-lysine ligase